jgi:hypothetical protein
MLEITVAAGSVIAKIWYLGKNILPQVVILKILYEPLF